MVLECIGCVDLMWQWFGQITFWTTCGLVFICFHWFGLVWIVVL